MDARLEEAAAGIISLLDEAPAGTFDTALIAYGWTLGNQNALPVLDECLRRGAHPQPSMPFRV